MSDDRLHRTASPAIPGISDSVRVTTGDLVFVSGAVGLGPDGSAASDFETEIDLCFTDLSRALETGGASLASVLKITVYIVDLTQEKLATFRTVRDRWIDPHHMPASTLIGVAALFSDKVTIEIEAIAAP